MADQLAKLYEELESDTWRSQEGFSDEVGVALAELADPETSDEEVKSILANWIAKNQPCLFGRIAAKKGLIEYCVLRETDLLATDELVRTKIQQARLVLRFEGPGSEGLRQPTKEEIADGLQIFTVRFIAAKDGRPDQLCPR